MTFILYYKWTFGVKILGHFPYMGLVGRTAVVKGRHDEKQNHSGLGGPCLPQTICAFLLHDHTGMEVCSLFIFLPSFLATNDAKSFVKDICT